MISVRLKGNDLERIRFARSPLMEVTESLWMLASRHIQPIHQSWFDEARGKLARVDLELLSAVVPARPMLASFLLPGASDPETTIAGQLRMIDDLPADELRRQIEDVWRGDPLPARADELISDGSAGPRRLAEALWQYWTLAIEPHWQQMCAVYDDDVAFRAAKLTKGGVGALLATLHPQVRVEAGVVWISKPRDKRQDLPEGGLLLVPSAFAWPNLIFEPGEGGTASLTYAVRGVANLWGRREPASTGDDALGALLGRTRAAILLSLAVPHSTTELALKLNVSPPSVSQHLSVLRRNGLVTSWRTGRKVLYRRTALATSVVEASGSAQAAGTDSAG